MPPLRALGTLLLTSGLACGTDHSPARGANGNFAGTFEDDQAYLALTLSERDGSVAGIGWLRAGSSVGRLVVSGTYSSPGVELELAYDYDIDGERDAGTSPLELAGTLGARQIRARLSGEPDLQLDLVLGAVDTTATAMFEWAVEGSATITQRGMASFTIPHGLHLDFSTGPVSDRVVLGGRKGRPQVGRYPIGLDTASVYQAYLSAQDPPYGSFYQAVSGELRVDVSTPQALIGSFQFTADNVYEAGRVTVTGRYSAACGDTRCE